MSLKIMNKTLRSKMLFAILMFFFVQSNIAYGVDAIFETKYDFYQTEQDENYDSGFGFFNMQFAAEFPVLDLKFFSLGIKTDVGILETNRLLTNQVDDYDKWIRVPFGIGTVFNFHLLFFKPYISTSLLMGFGSSYYKKYNHFFAGLRVNGGLSIYLIPKLFYMGLDMQYSIIKYSYFSTGIKLGFHV